MVQVLQLLCSSALGLLARGHSHLSLELCVSPVELRLCHKTETWQRLVFCDLRNTQVLNLRLTASPPCVTFPFRLQLEEIFTVRHVVFGCLFVLLFMLHERRVIQFSGKGNHLTGVMSQGMLQTSSCFICLCAGVSVWSSAYYCLCHLQPAHSPEEVCLCYHVSLTTAFLAPLILCVSHSCSSLLFLLFHEIPREAASVCLRADVMAVLSPAKYRFLVSICQQYYRKGFEASSTPTAARQDS